MARLLSVAARRRLMSAPSALLAAGLTTAYEALAASMDPILRAALVDDTVNEDDEALVRKLNMQHRQRSGLVLRRKCAISRRSCAALRGLVDVEQDVTPDSVDGQAQHQLNLSAQRLTELIGQDEVATLWSLADELLAAQHAEAESRARTASATLDASLPERIEEAHSGFRVDVFVRRYSRTTRPWIGFHQDVSNVTINLALSDDRCHEGGRLHAIIDGRHGVISRAEGEATAHGDDVMHAVSSMRSGVRYSLIMFFFALRDTAHTAQPAPSSIGTVESQVPNPPDLDVGGPSRAGNALMASCLELLAAANEAAATSKRLDEQRHELLGVFICPLTAKRTCTDRSTEWHFLPTLGVGQAAVQSRSAHDGHDP